MAGRGATLAAGGSAAAPSPTEPGSPPSGCDVRAALAAERAHVDALRRADADAAKANPLGQPIGLALSGGGIRSATVGLGVLQALAEARLLRRIDYLSTVSGGGYIGSWLSAVLHRQQRSLGAGAGLGAVEELIAPAEIRKKDEEPAEIAFLRAYSNYLTPRLGLFSADTLAALTGYARNLLLSLLIAVFSLGSVLAALHLAVAAVALQIQGTALVGSAWPDLAKTLLGLSGLLVSFLLTLQSQDLRADLPEGTFRNVLLKALQFAQREFGNLVLPLLGFGLVMAGTFLESKRPLAPAWDDTLDLGAGALLCFAAGALLARFVTALGSEAAESEDATAFVVRALLRLLALRSYAIDWLTHQWREALRYTVATFSCTFVAWKLVRAVDGLDPVAPLVALFRGPAIAVGIALAVFVVWLGVIGTTYSELTREWLSRLMGSLVGAALGWLAIGALLVGARPTLAWWLDGRWHLRIEVGWLGLLAPPTLLAVLMAVLLRARRPVATAALDAPPTRRGLAQLALPAACTVVIVLFLAALTIAFQALLIRVAPADGAISPAALPAGTGWRDAVRLHLAQIGAALDHVGFDDVPPSVEGNLENAADWIGVGWAALPIVSLALACFGGALLAFRYVDVNVFSLQNLYRNRLVRCYLGAANQRQRLQNPYAGFDPADDLPLAALAGQRPFHLVNTALNITQGEDLAWQQRKAASFCFTPLHCGYWLEAANLAGLVADDRVQGGYARTTEFALEPAGVGGAAPALMLGTAMATSGAAVSPQMGFASRGVLAFVLTLLNVRLGRWFPNTTGRPGGGELGRHSPKSAGSWYLSELLGRTNEKSEWVYLSDGGHFENLGIYELVRRRCRFIVAIDAGADPSMGFGDLGNCVRKCRVDFGVRIELDLDRFAPAPGARRPAAAHALGTVRYPASGEAAAFSGEILYLKSCVPAASNLPVPADILAFLAENRLFPHQPTSDQWFTESQFESYRQLGYWLAKLALPAAREVFDEIAKR